MVAVEFAEEGRAHQIASGEKAGIFCGLGIWIRGAARVVGFMICGFWGSGDGEVIVEVADERGKSYAGIVETFAKVCRFGGRVDGDAVIVCVDGFDEFIVEFSPKDLDVFAFGVQTGALGDDGFTKMEVDEAGGGEFGGFVGECGVEGALVMVVAVLSGVIFATDIYDRVAVGQEGWIAGPEESTGVVGGEKAEEVDG